jgi:hypothetical protein
MSYESELFALMKDAFIHKSWDDSLYHEQKRTFPKMTVVYTFEAETGEKYSLWILDSRCLVTSLVILDYIFFEVYKGIRVSER